MGLLKVLEFLNIRPQFYAIIIRIANPLCHLEDKRDAMQKLIKAFEDIMVAITFAEAGEYDEARKITSQEQEHETATVAGPELTAVRKA